MAVACSGFEPMFLSSACQYCTRKSVPIMKNNDLYADNWNWCGEEKADRKKPN